jgi:iron complex transport system substrate-binding protein
LRPVARESGRVPTGFQEISRHGSRFRAIGDHPLITAGGASFLDDLIARAGGVNVAHEISREYPIISAEKVIEWNPDIIIIPKMNPREETTVQLPQRIGWAGISAVREGRIIDDISPDLLFRPGPRLIEGVKALAARLCEDGPSDKKGP